MQNKKIDANPDPKSPANRDWPKIVSNWERSGLSQKAYCEQYHIKPHIFSYYRNKLRAAKKRDKKLIPLKAMPMNANASSDYSSDYKLKLNNGAVLSIPQAAEPNGLQVLLKMLGVLSC